MGSVYLQLWDGMVGQYIATPLNTNVKYWAQRWFYMPQREYYVACDIDQIPMSSARWSEKPSASGMEQVRELLALIDRRRVNGIIVVTNFTFWRCQPSKERAHPAFEFRGDTDGTQEVPEPINREEVMRQIGVLFNLTGHLKIDDQERAFGVGNLPLEVRVFVLVWPNSFFVAMYSLVLLKIHG